MLYATPRPRRAPRSMSTTKKTLPPEARNSEPERRSCESPSDDCDGELGHFLISVTLIREHLKNLTKTISIPLLDLQLRNLSEASRIKGLNLSRLQQH